MFLTPSVRYYSEKNYQTNLLNSTRRNINNALMRKTSN